MSAFNKLAKKLSKEPDVTSPKGLAAFIGRHKIGQSAMTARSIAGRKRNT
jgi:hypothetical protein